MYNLCMWHITDIIYKLSLKLCNYSLKYFIALDDELYPQNHSKELFKKLERRDEFI
nr:MAG TPA: hypothetical protein [Caudoviricetes sp.]